MDLISIVILIFVILEILNVFMLYFTPGTRRGNGMGVFNAYEKAKSDPEVYELVKYLINWVAGTKLIFITLLIVIILTAGTVTKVYSVLALVFSILTYFWRLNPIIKKLDKGGQISPKGYSKQLSIMISVFIIAFLLSLFFNYLLPALLK